MILAVHYFHLTFMLRVIASRPSVTSYSYCYLYTYVLICFMTRISNCVVCISALPPPAFLPSSFCMYTTLVAMTGWFQDSIPLAVMGVAGGAIVGWPFSALIG